MTMAADLQEIERKFVERLQPSYEDAGYSFIAYPDKSKLPDFMGDYRPDAIALKGDKKVAIEIKSRRTPNADISIRHIRKIFEGHEDWQFRVMFISEDARETARIPISSPELIRHRLNDVQELVRLGQSRAAFLLAWSILEAVAHLVEPETGRRPYSPGTIIQSLTMNGRISQETDRNMRSLINTRNGLVHGNLEIEPDKIEIETLIDVIISLLDQAVYG